MLESVGVGLYLFTDIHMLIMLFSDNAFLTTYSLVAIQADGSISASLATTKVILVKANSSIMTRKEIHMEPFRTGVAFSR